MSKSFIKRESITIRWNSVKFLKNIIIKKEGIDKSDINRRTKYYQIRVGWDSIRLIVLYSLYVAFPSLLGLIIITGEFPKYQNLWIVFFFLFVVSSLIFILTFFIFLFLSYFVFNYRYNFNDHLQLIISRLEDECLQFSGTKVQKERILNEIKELKRIFFLSDYWNKKPKYYKKIKKDFSLNEFNNVIRFGDINIVNTDFCFALNELSAFLISEDEKLLMNFHLGIEKVFEKYRISKTEKLFNLLKNLFEKHRVLDLTGLLFFLIVGALIFMGFISNAITILKGI